MSLKIIETNENPLESIIEKSELTTRFTLQQVKDHQEYTRKTLKETKAQLEAHEAQDKIALEILPILKEIPEDKWNLVMMYAGRQVQRPESIALIETSETTLASYEEQIKEIEKLLGITEESNG